MSARLRPLHPRRRRKILERLRWDPLHLWDPAHPERFLLPLVVVQAVTGLAAIAALIFALQLGPRVNVIERREGVIERTVKEVVPGKSSPPGLAGRALDRAARHLGYALRMEGVDLNGAADLAPREEPQTELSMTPELFPGVWANYVQTFRTEHEVTVDFYRVGPGGRQAMAVARINCSPLLLEQLGKAVSEQLEQA